MTPTPSDLRPLHESALTELLAAAIRSQRALRFVSDEIASIIEQGENGPTVIESDIYSRIDVAMGAIEVFIGCAVAAFTPPDSDSSD